MMLKNNLLKGAGQKTMWDSDVEVGMGQINFVSLGIGQKSI